jgi:hypothetical protein
VRVRKLHTGYPPIKWKSQLQVFKLKFLETAI